MTPSPSSPPSCAPASEPYPLSRLHANSEQFTHITSPDEVVQEDWLYDYDLEFFGTPLDPDMRVKRSWVGRRAGDAVWAWEYFRKPVLHFDI